MSVSSQIEESAVTLVVFGIFVFALIYAYQKLLPPSADSQPSETPYTGAGQKQGEVLGLGAYNNPFTYPWGDLWTNLKNVFEYGFVPGAPGQVAAAPAGTSVSDYNPNLAPGDIPAISQAFQNWS